MINLRFQTFIYFIFIVAACSNDDNGPTDSNASEYDEALAQEYQALPETVLIRVQSGGSTREMRIPASDVLITDDQSALTAFESGVEARMLAATRELDRTSSEPAWAPFQGQSSYGAYTPQVYSLANRGYTYSYSNVASFSVGGFSIFAYHRPPCSPEVCRPSVAGVSGGIVQAGPAGIAVGLSKFDKFLAEAFKKYRVYPVSDHEYFKGSNAKYALGERLFNDTLLSTSKGVSCASCHVTTQGTTINSSLSPTGFVLSGEKHGPFGPKDLLGRNPPSLFNLGHSSFRNMFWDSRVAAAPYGVNGYITPAGGETPPGLDSTLAAQALFPLATGTEMAGCAAYVNNTQQSRSYKDIWDEILARVLSKQEYQTMFAAAYPELQGIGYGIQHLVNAIAAFESVRWRADHSPFDAYLRGDLTALTENQKRGAFYFYGEGGCGGCHSGPFQTDYEHHAVGVVQIGPGEGDGPVGWSDFGYGRVTKNPRDNYKFKTAPLRNIAHTGPWGHSGAYSTLFAFIDHYCDPVRRFDLWQTTEAIMPKGFDLSKEVLGAWYDSRARVSIKRANVAKPNRLGVEEVKAIEDFLNSLTDKNSLRP